METMGMLSEVEWKCLHGMCNEEADFMNELFADSSFQSERNESSLWPSHESTINMVVEEGPVFQSLDQKRKSGMPDAVFEDAYSSANPYVNVVPLQEVSRKKRKDSISSCKVEEEPNAGVNGLSSTSSDSGDDTKGEAVNLNGKARKGSATDPQSLYARKRREKINERLRILQSLVPNGTKVDISTMLEEAVEYVKFLQLQIKLLSSDEYWMYAPIAYNGMNLGFRS